MTVTVTVLGPARGTLSVPTAIFHPAECVCTWSWGLQPATALIDWVSAQQQPAIQVGAAMQIDMAGGAANGGQTFYGLCMSVVPVLASNGFSQMQEFVDNRQLLQMDSVFGMFNVKDHRIVNGQFIRRYKHILPADAVTRRETYTNTPYDGNQILDFLFNAPTVQTAWNRTYHPFLENPVYELDWMNGRQLGQCLLEVSEALGLVFTLIGGPFQLVWTVKGIGTLPAFPPLSENRRSGIKLTENPTQVFVAGDRNLYQVMNIDMQPDWLSSWENFWDFNLFVQDLFENEVTEAPYGSIAAGTAYTDIDAGNDNNAGYLLARARAQTITVEQYARLRDNRDAAGNAFRDYRKFQNRARTQMPVALYLSNVMFKAFRFPANFTFLNTEGFSVGLTSVYIADRLLAQVTHDPITGVMTYTTGLPSTPNGYAIVQGYSVGSDGFKSLHPEYFDIDNWYSTQAVWQEMPFQIDNSGEGDQFILFDDPIINSANVIQLDETGSFPVLNAAAALTSCPVRVSLTLAAEDFRFAVFTENGTEFGSFRDEVQNVSGLNGEFVMTSPVATAFELAYADGLTARQKAVELSLPLLNLQLFYNYGGYTVQGSNGTQLSAMIDRVTCRVNSEGLSEEVDFTNERSKNITIGPNGQYHLQLQPEREFDRVAQLAPLLAGQAELRDQANQLRAEAGFLLKHPKISRNLMETFHLLMGMDSIPDVSHVNNGTGKLATGTPLFRESDSNNATMPNDGSPPTLSDPVFMGVTTCKNEPANGPVRTTRSGNGNVVFARVQGPVSTGDSVGAGGTANTYLVASPTTAVGNAEAPITGSDIELIPVRMAGGSGGEGKDFQGVYVPGEAYNTDDEVVIQAGGGEGTYVSVADNNTNDPRTGINWIQIGWNPQWF